MFVTHIHMHAIPIGVLLERALRAIAKRRWHDVKVGDGEPSLRQVVKQASKQSRVTLTFGKH